MGAALGARTSRCRIYAATEGNGAESAGSRRRTQTMTEDGTTKTRVR